MKLMIRHNMEMAHRLSRDTTKCKQIHGHGMQVELVFPNLEQNDDGMCVNRVGAVMEFGAMKRQFRNHIDSVYDHHLVLNEEDPFAGKFFRIVDDEIDNSNVLTLPGLTTCPGEPTVENLARWIGEWSAKTFQTDVICHIDETKTNGAEVYTMYTGAGTTKVQL